jgi:hypothetical protein
VTLENTDHLQNPDESLGPDPSQPPEEIDPEVLYPGANPPRRSQKARTSPERLIPSFGGKSYESTAGVTAHLVHPEAGKKEFKERGEDAASKNLSQLHFRDTFEPINPKDLADKDRQEVLESHLFLEEKRDARPHGRIGQQATRQD